jgi:hypothetical protein
MPSELAAFANLGDAVAWVGISDAVLGAVRETVGDFQLLQKIVLIPRVAWETAVGAARVAVEATADGTKPARPLRAFEVGSSGASSAGGSPAAWATR